MTLPRPDMPIEVDVSAFGRFHAFRLAAELDRLGVLHRLFTSYPRSIDGVPASKITNPFWLKGAEAAIVRLTRRYLAPERVWRRCGELYDGFVARQISRSESTVRRVFHGWVSHSQASLRQAARKGYATFVECSCPHPRFQVDLLQCEAESMGERYFAPPAWIERVSAECALSDRIVVPSEYTRSSYLAAGYVETKIVKVPLGVDLTGIQMVRLRSRRWTERSPFRVLMIGTSGLRKGAYYLLEAWRRLGLRSAELVIRCDVPEKGRPLLAQSGVTHLGPVSRSALMELYATATVFCFPSIDDGFGMVLLEAMAHGLPVVTTHHVGASELMTQAEQGFIVPIRNIDQIAAALERLYLMPDLVDVMGRRARLLAERFTWARYADDMIRHYQSAMASVAPARKCS